MAKKEKAAFNIAEGFDVKLAGGKKGKDSKPERETIDSPIIANPAATTDKKAPKTFKVVDICIAKSQEIESLQMELSVLEKDIIDAAKKAKNTAYDGDKFVKTVDVTGTDLKIQVQFKDAFSKMEETMEPSLKEVFVDHYPVMFKKTTDYVLTDDEVKIKELKTMLGDRFDIYFATDTYIKPTKDFSETYFKLRKTLKPEQKSVIDKVLSVVQYSPSVKYPK